MASERQLSDVLSEFARTMVTDFPIQGILDHLVLNIVEVMSITAAGVTLISPGVQPHYIAASSDAAMRFEQLQTELEEGPCLAAYHTGEAVSVPDLRVEERFPRFADRGVEAGLAAVFTFPLHHGDRRLGALDLYRDAPGALTPEAMDAAQTLADVAAAYLLIAQARADLQDSSDRAREAALHDALTGLPNRVLMLERLAHAFRRGRRSDKTTAVLFVDLDRFKAINDTHGHRLGDAVLVAVAQRLTGVLRPGDTLARLYGDEFAILCEDLDNAAQASVIVARVDAALAHPVVVSGVPIDLSASVGLAFAERDHAAPEQLLHDADIAMYQAKRRRGVGRHVVDLRNQHLADYQAALTRDLAGVTGRGELGVEYQPIVDTADGRVTGVEALVRWAHPVRGMVPPSVLIPLAEYSGLLPEIGRWVLEQAWTDRQRWARSPTGADIAMSVNVSVQQLMSAGFVDTVATVLQTIPADPRLLTLEVTEGVFVLDSERALLVLNDLRDMGVMLALDDFGTGYSSLSYLRQRPVDVVKIDRSFIADVGRDPVSHTIVSAVVQLAHGLGMAVVAEGVESAHQYHELDRLGCDSCQGYYFARPMSAPGVEALLRQPADRRILPPTPTRGCSHESPLPSA